MNDMLRLAIELLGGIGLFLLGMIIMTDGLRQVAGKTMRSNLMAYTNSPLSGVVCGSLSTAILQSSSAVTVATVGFVRAGLMSFSHSLGVIFGANIGTTITGWLVLLFGFKLKLGLLVFPLIFVGALLKLFAKPKLAALGMALAGFGLIFTGIETLQAGMGGLKDLFDFASLPATTMFDRILVLFIGVLFTLITQSSSAGVAATLTALFSGLIHFEQAAALVVGMDIGTTVTAALATTGASTAAKRTGFSHVIYNLITGITALLIITPYIWVWETLSNQAIETHAEVALIAFHTTFNMLGVMLVLPFTRQFAAMMEKLLPSPKHMHEGQLDEDLLGQTDVALDLAYRTLCQQLERAMKLVLSQLDGLEDAKQLELMQLQSEVDECQIFIDGIILDGENPQQRSRLLDLVHALDHLQRLIERIEDKPKANLDPSQQSQLQEAQLQISKSIKHFVNKFSPKRWQKPLRQLQKSHDYFANEYPAFRQKMLDQIVNDQIEIDQASYLMESYRWLQRISQHIYRSSKHLAAAGIGRD